MAKSITVAKDLEVLSMETPLDFVIQQFPLDVKYFAWHCLLPIGRDLTPEIFCKVLDLKTEEIVILRQVHLYLKAQYFLSQFGATAGNMGNSPM